MAVTLTSNGSADSNLYKWIVKKVNLLRFSIDGLSTTYVILENMVILV